MPRSPSTQAQIATQEAFGERMRRLRRLKELSQTELGQRIGVHYTQIGRYERGESLPSSDKLKALSDTLGVTPSYLMEGAADDVEAAAFEDRQLLRQFHEVERLPASEREVIKKLLDAFLLKWRIQEMASS
jgi:transcriptional regulator with XRE-family HTH domain